MSDEMIVVLVGGESDIDIDGSLAKTMTIVVLVLVIPSTQVNAPGECTR